MTKRVRKKRHTSFIILIACILFACYVTITITGQRAKIKSASQKLEDLKLQLNNQLLENEELAHLIEDGEESAYMERIAREKLGYGMSDERVFYDISGN